MRDELEKILSIGLGFISYSKEKIEKVINELVEKGEVTKSEAAEIIEKLTKKGEEQKKDINDYIANQVEKIISKLNLAYKSDIVTEERIREIVKEEIDKFKNNY
ncbi:phasin family protein [Caldicellulosiruptoraceae bacterium PP1]